MDSDPSVTFTFATAEESELEMLLGQCWKENAGETMGSKKDNRSADL